MRKFRVDSPVTLWAGEIELLKAQAAPRAHCLKEVKKGRYEILSAVQFKAGEVIGIPGQPDKALAQQLTELDAKGNALTSAAPAEPAAPPPIPTPPADENSDDGEDDDAGAGDDEAADKQQENDDAE